MGDQPARRGPGAPGRGADRRRPAALPRLLRQLRPGPVLPDRRARLAVRPVAAELADPARGAGRHGRRAGLRPRAARARREPLALARLARRRRGDGVSRASRTPTRPRWRSGSARCCSPARAPAGAGALAGLAFVFRFDLGLAAALGTVLLALARGERGAALRCAAGAALVAALLMAPFVLSAADELWDQTIGFALDEQSLQRLPLPGACEGGFEPNELLQLLLPLRAARRARPLARAGAGHASAAAALGGAAAGAGRRSPTCSRAPTSSTWCRSPRCCRCCWPAPSARERDSGRRAAAAGARGRAGADRPARAGPQADGGVSPPPLATLDADVADGVKAPTEEARALERLAAYVRRPGARRRAGVRGQPAPRPRCGWATRWSTCCSTAPIPPATT